MAIWQPGDEITADRLNSVPYGLDADKPANPVVGQIYFATDTQKLYRCYTDGEWIPNIEIQSGVVKASDSVKNSNNEFHGVYSNNYYKLKEIKLNEDLAECRIKFDVKTNNADNTAFAKIYKNGVAIGKEHITNSTSNVTFSEDFADFRAGDLIQIYGHGSAVSIGNMKLCYDKYRYISRIENYDLVRPTVITSIIDPYTISTTNQDP